MNKRTLSGITLAGFIFFVLYNYSFTVLAINIDVSEQRRALTYFILPVLYIVYHIVKDQEILPKHIRIVGLFAVSFFVIYSCTQFLITLSLIISDEAFAYQSWFLRFLPLFIWIGMMLFGAFKKRALPVSKVFPLLKILIVVQAVLLFFILFLYTYNVYMVKTGMTFFIQTPEYILSYLGTVTSISYLIFLKQQIDPTTFRTNYFIGAAVAIIGMLLIAVVSNNGASTTVTYNFENSYYLKSLTLNYGRFFAGINGLFTSISQILISCFFFSAVTDQVNDQWKGKKKVLLYSSISLLVLLLMSSVVYRSSIDMEQILRKTKEIKFTAQAIYTLIIVIYGFHIGIKKYDPLPIKVILYAFSSFVLVYVVYYLSKIWDFLPRYLVRQLTSVQYVFLFISLFVILYYTFETILLWYAYSHRKKTTDLGTTIVEMEYDIYVMIPCMNEELVIGNTLKSILKSKYEHLHVWVIDDASEDNTAEEVRKFNDSRVKLIQRVKPHAQEGKGEALNDVYSLIKEEIEQKQQATDEVLIAIIDADTLLPDEYFEKVNFVFNNQKDVTGLQSKVRVISSTLNRSQDLEFAEIINATQTFRSMTGTVAFGGNGQFCKLSVLDSLEEKPWSKSLVEDYDLSTRLFLSDTHTKNSQLDDIYITQSGIDRDPAALVKQRVRWSQGNIQSSKYILPIIRSKSLDKKQKFEFLMTLSKPWLMMIEYLIIIYSFLAILDIYLFYGINQLMVRILVLFFIMFLYILSINFIWACLYNRNKERKFSLLLVGIDTYYLTLFLLQLSQIYPQAAIRHFKSESGWDKTKRQQNLDEKN